MNPVKGLGFIWRQKAKISLLISLVIIFTLLLFPLQDLRELVTIKLYEQSGRKVFVLFNTIQIGLFPPYLSVEQIKISTPHLNSSLNLNALKVVPYSDLFVKQEPSGEVILEGLWSGQTRATLRPGKLLENNVKSQKVTLRTDTLNLAEMSSNLGFPVKLQGVATLLAEGDVDPSLVTQPDFNFDLNVKNLVLPASQVPTLMGPLNLPQMGLGPVVVKGRWAGGKIQINQLQFGNSNQDVSGSGTGFLNLNVQNRSGQIFTQTGAYQIDLDFVISRKIEPKLALFLGLLESYKTQVTEGSRYRFKLTGNSFYAPPNFIKSN